MYVIASALWLAAMLSVVLALWREGLAPRSALVLLAIGSAAFGRSHVRPWGAAGMAAVFAGVLWIELAARLEQRRPGEARRA
jgi:hypothetical protein